MGSPIIGRAPCPGPCGFGAAHVKESARCLFVFCPDCGVTMHARTERQRANLLKVTKLDAGPAPAAAPTPTPTGQVEEPPTPTPTPTGQVEEPPTPTPTPAAPAGRRSTLLGVPL